MDVITSHENADFDCLGAMVAAKRLYPDAVLVFSGARERNLREFFVKSTVYAYDFRRLRDIDLDAVTRLILVDVRQVDRIGPFGEVARRPGVEVHVYDHHPETQGALRADLEVVEPAGSTVTVLTHLFMQRGIVPTADEATLMMLGLYEDTGSLLYASTCERDYQAAAFLLRHGANLNVVADFLTQELTSGQVGLLNELIQNCRPIDVGGVEVMLAHASTDQYVGDLAMLAHKLKDMENYNALLLAVRMGDRVFLVGRSRIPEVDVGEILREFGGGGHEYAASATVKDMPLPQVLQKLQRTVRRKVQPRGLAAQLMSAPARTVSARATLAEARQLLVRAGVSGAPVVDGDRLVGILSRQTVERALQHELEELPVEEVMARDFATATPETTLLQLQELIVGGNQRLVPILRDGSLLGVITRTDLLRQMVNGAVASGADEELLYHDAVLKRRQLARMIRSDLPPRLVTILQHLGEVANALAMPAYLVGGFVRDLVLRRQNLDVDLVVEGNGIAFAEEFARRYSCRVRSHHKFSTAVLIFDDGFKLDIATARTEYYAHPAALPTVEHASIKLDLYRRDFTINTLAITLDPAHFGELLDFFGGLRDLRDKAVRVLHSLSFVEDPTRVFRAIRFEQRLGFHICTQTEYLLRSAVRRGFLGRLGGPRLFAELTAILSEADPLPAVQRMAALDLLRHLHPQLELSAAIENRFRETNRCLHWFDLLYTGERRQAWLVYLLALTEELTPEAVADMCRHLGMAPRELAVLTSQARRGRFLLRRLEQSVHSRRPLRPSELRHGLDGLPLELLLYLVALAGSDEVRQPLSQYLTRDRRLTPHLTGHDLKRLGLPPGPLYRKVLADLLARRMDGELTSRSQAEEHVRHSYLHRLPAQKR